MRISDSHHHVPLRANPKLVWSKTQDKFRPWLHLRNIACLLDEAVLRDGTLTVSGKGKKRAFPYSASSRKRVRTDGGSITPSTSTPNTPDWPEHQYPILPQPACAVIEHEGDIQTTTVWRHTFFLQLLKDGGNRVNAALNATQRHEEDLFDRKLKLLFEGIEEPVTVNLGAVDFLEYENRLVASLANATRENHDDEAAKLPNWLCLLPTLTDGRDDDSYDFGTKFVEDLLLACHHMRLMRRVLIEGHLELIALPFDWSAMIPQEVPFQLVIHVNISFILPFVFQPCPPGIPKRKASLLEQSKRRLLHHLYFPPSESGPDTVVNIPFFYSCLKPAPLLPSKRAENAMQPKTLVPKLLPFQRRSVAWLLHREGLRVTAAGKIVPSTDFKEYSFWDQIHEGNHTWYYNRLSDEIASDITPAPPVLGGILAEEPGLGKTLETISLMLLNPAPPDWNPSLKRWDPEAQLEVCAVKSTLIVTPPALQKQWIDELKAHAPSLKVLVYEGWSKVTSSKTEKKKARKAKPKAVSRRSTKREATPPSTDDPPQPEPPFDWPAEASQYDVVITTYNILKFDLNVARATYARSRRDNVTYLENDHQVPRSPLVKVEWHRVVMDEVQMGGGGKAEEMVSLIPRRSSLAVSGTPARAQISDLIKVLRFLRVNTSIGSVRMWARLLKKSYADEFSSFFRNYAIRTLKASVRNELTIPQQRRYLVPIELGMVERHVYDHAFEVVLLEIGLDARGVAAFGGWEVDANVLRNAVRRLRGICTHPQVGQLSDKHSKLGTVKSIADVLQSMRDVNWRNVMEDRKSKILSLAKLAQLQQHVDADRNRYQRALETLQEAERQADELIAEINDVMAAHHEKGEVLKKEAAARRQALALDTSTFNGKGKGKERAISEPLIVDDIDDDSHEDLEDRGLPRNPAGEEHMTKRRALQHRLREATLVLHRVKILQGDVYHMLGEAFKSAEDAAYTAADDSRRGLLRASAVEAMRAMTQLEEQATEQHVSLSDLLIETPLLGQGGIRSYDLMEECNNIVAVINDQSELLWQWRTRITELLTEPLTDQKEADGQEYQRTLDRQQEAEVYLETYPALLADRRQAFSSERNLLTEHQVRERKVRTTKASKRAQFSAVESPSRSVEDLMEGIEEARQFDNENEIGRRKDLLDKRKELLQLLSGRAIKSIVVDLQAVKGRIHSDKDPEHTIVIRAIATLRRFIKEQNDMIGKFETDLAAIRKAFNQRVLYFRQLQEISDSVQAATWEGPVDVAIEQCVADRAVLDAKINTNRARYRYMLHLAKKREQGIVDEEEETCVLCRCEFIRGFITHCAHVFCEGCLKAWMVRKEGKTCPVCRVALNPDTLQRFTVHEKDSPPPRPINGEPAPRSRRTIEYNVIDPEVLQEIQTMESFGDFGSKIQTLVRHLLYLKSTEPGAKSIVFSAWADSLFIVQHALQENGIKCLRIDQRSRRQSAANNFKSDPTIDVLLLHGEKENAGLNITCASRVFLLESVVHHSFEIQAIARIDRMGQTRPTEVYCYYAEETVERSILDLAARQGLSLYTQDNSEGTLDLSSFSNLSAEKPQVDAPAKKKVQKKKQKQEQKGDFIFRVDDMLAILFPHMYEDVEYLLPVQEETEQPIASGSGS